MKKKRLKFNHPWALALAGVIVAIPIALYLYGALTRSAVEFEAAPLIDKVKVGEMFDVKVNIKNGSTSDITNVQLVLNLPDGVISAEGDRNKLQSISLPNIGAGGHEEIVRLIALPLSITPVSGEVSASGAEGPLPGVSTERKIGLSLSYSIGNLTATFQQEKEVTMRVDNLSYELDAKIPEKVLSNQEFAVEVSYKYSGNVEPPDAKLSIDYPEVFRKTGSAPQSNSGENSWTIGKLKNGDTGKVSLSGAVDLPDDSILTMTAKILITIMGRDYALIAKSISIPIAPSPLSLKVFAGDNPKQVFRPGDTINYTLIYKNSTNVPMQNISISAKLAGQMYDFGTLAVNNAVFDSRTKTVSWSMSTLPGLSRLDAGVNGSVAFSIKLLSAYPIRRLNDKNFTAKVDARIESPTVPALVDATKTVNSAALENKIAGNITLEAKAFFRDADSQILNTGSLPPKIDQSTDFTIHWLLTNYSTDMKNVEVRAKMEDGVVFTGAVKANTTSLPTVDEEAGEIVWKLGKVFATTGITGEKPEAIFQIKATPSMPSLFGNYMPLLSETTIKATDDFTGLDVGYSAPALTTRLEADKTVGENDGKVSQ